MKRQRKQKKSLIKKPLLLIGTLVVVAATAMAILELTDRTYIFHDAPRPVTASSDTKGEPQNATPPAPDSSAPSEDGGSMSNDSNPGDNKAPSSGPAVALLDPSASDFVSNHKPSLSKSPGMSSTCTTTPGAICVISFTNGSITKSLPAQTTDRGGSAYWDWKLQDIGLTTGTWRITAAATLSGQTKTAADATNLEVSP